MELVTLKIFNTEAFSISCTSQNPCSSVLNIYYTTEGIYSSTLDLGC